MFIIRILITLRYHDLSSLRQMRMESKSDSSRRCDTFVRWLSVELAISWWHLHCAVGILGGAPTAKLTPRHDLHVETESQSCLGTVWFVYAGQCWVCRGPYNIAEMAITRSGLFFCSEASSTNPWMNEWSALSRASFEALDALHTLDALEISTIKPVILPQDSQNSFFVDISIDKGYSDLEVNSRNALPLVTVSLIASFRHAR